MKWQCSSLQELSQSALFTQTRKVATPPSARSQCYPQKQQRYVGKDAILLNFLTWTFPWPGKIFPPSNPWATRSGKKEAKVPKRENMWNFIFWIRIGILSSGPWWSANQRWCRRWRKSCRRIRAVWWSEISWFLKKETLSNTQVHTSTTPARCSFLWHNSEEMELKKVKDSEALIGWINEPSNQNQVGWVPSTHHLQRVPGWKSDLLMCAHAPQMPHPGTKTRHKPL